MYAHRLSGTEVMMNGRGPVESGVLELELVEADVGSLAETLFLGAMLSPEIVIQGEPEVVEGAEPPLAIPA